jgi:hypothetical protein
MSGDEMMGVQKTLTDHEGRIRRLEARMSEFDEALEKIMETLTKLRVEIGQLQTQTKITWFLMSLIIAGLVSVAFGLFAQ